MSETVARRCSAKKKACNFVKNETPGQPPTLLEKRFRHKCFPKNFQKFLRSPLL